MRWKQQTWISVWMFQCLVAHEAQPATPAESRIQPRQPGWGDIYRCGTTHHSATSTTGCDQAPSQGKGGECTSCTMHDISVSTAGIDKLLQNLHPDKAAGPDEFRPLLYKELQAEIAPILQVIFNTSIITGTWWLDQSQICVIWVCI